VLIMTEVVHSFHSAEWREHTFALKADLFKAFDTLDWRFLDTTLRKFNFPQQLITLILSCVTGSRFSIKLNGVAGDGFIMPGRGLRQGCPLSPYLFILSMEVLSRMLQGAQQMGDLKGIVLATGAPALTHSMYADDLVLFGQAEEAELNVLKTIMGDFGRISGLKINDQKSVVWFSKCTTIRRKRLVTQTFPAKGSDDTTTYLGYPMPHGKVTYRHYKHMEDKIVGKFGGWKVSTLSHAGRLALARTCCPNVL
jgi:Reverse transcriptase (RNA-dependent DNA polymerase)